MSFTNSLITRLGSVSQGDALGSLRAMESKSIDLIFGSPPYEAQRRYNGEPGITSLVGEAWVSWMLEIFSEATRVSRGLVAFVVNGFTKDFENSMTPFLLAADLKRSQDCPDCGLPRPLRSGLWKLGSFCSCADWAIAAGEMLGRSVKPLPTFRVRKPPIFARWGTPGSGGPDWLRDNYELIVCATSRDVVKLPYGEPTAIGEPPKYEAGGVATNRTKSDKRTRAKAYAKPKLANPGNVRWHKVGGGLMGSPLAHDNEAPFPQSLAREFVLMFCPPGGVVCDPFSGSGTTAAAAVLAGRRYLCFDARASQVELSNRRIGEAIAELDSAATVQGESENE